MTPFEFIFGFITIVSSLALTQLATSFVSLILHSNKVRFSPVLAAFMWTAFATTVVNWAAFWPLRNLEQWPASLVLLQIFTVLVQFVFCALVSPIVGDDGIDLVAVNRQRRSRYLSALVLLAVLAMGWNFALRDMYPDWVAGVVGCVIYAATALLTLAPSRLVQLTAAGAMALFNTIWMVLACGTFLRIAA